MNLMDYAFLQNMIDCHDRDRKTAEGWLETKPIMSVYTDVRNYYQGKCEMYQFASAKPNVGEKYVMYVNDKFANDVKLTNWTGDTFPLRVNLAHWWKRNGRFGSYRLQTVYASAANGELWRGTWSKDNADAVVMRRIA